MNDGLTDALDWNAPAMDVRLPQVVHAGVLLVLARLALVTLGFQRTAMMAHRASRSRRPRGNADLPHARAATYAVALAAALVPMRLRCLERSLILFYQLTRRGIPVTLRLGVRAYPFAAHAWVEHDGAPLNEIPDNLVEFDPIFELG